MPRFESLWIWLLGPALALSATTSGVVAAGPILPNLGWPGLTEDDLVRMHSTVVRLFEGKPVGSIEQWQNPDTNDAGEVGLIRTFEGHGMPCRTIEYRVQFGRSGNNPDHFVINWCRVADGSWKIAELRPP